MTVVILGAVAEPMANRTLGSYSHAEGSSQSTGTYSHAECGSTATGAWSHAEGLGTASSFYAHAEGTGTASGQHSHAGGDTCTASGFASRAIGVRAGAIRYGQHSQGGGQFAAIGDCQATCFVARRITTDATASLLTFNGSGTITLTAESCNVLTVPVSRAHRIRIDALARRTDAAGEHAAWTITCTLVRDSTGNARFIATPIAVTESEGAASAWTLALSIDTSNATNNYLVLTATGEASKTIRWAARIETVEIG